MAIQVGAQGPRQRSFRPVRRLFEGYSRDQRLFITEAMLVNSANVITGGAFLTGLLVLMGASDIMVGIIVSSGGWSLMLSLAASLVVERVRRKKALLTGVLLAFRVLTTLPVFLPMAMGIGMPTALTAAVMLVAGNALFSIYNTGFPIFFMDSLPKEGRAHYIYTRMLLIRIAYTVVSVAAGLLMDALNKSYTGFVIVFSLGLAVGIANVIVMSMIQGAEGATDAPAAGNPLRRIFEPITNKRYLRFLLFTFAYFFFLSISTSYTSLYQYKYLELSYGFITVYNTCIYVVMIAMTRAWGRLEERLGKLKVLVITSLLMAAELFVYALLTRQTLWLIALSPLLGGLGNSGFWACMLPYRYDLMPASGKTVYEGWFGFIYGGACLLGAFTGGSLQKVLPAIPTAWITFSPFQMLYLASGVLALAASLVFWHRAGKDRAACA